MAVCRRSLLAMLQKSGGIGLSKGCATYSIVSRWIVRALFSKKWVCHYIGDGTIKELFWFLVHMECHMDSNRKAGEEE